MDTMAGGWRWSAAGLAAVWAQENPRDSLFDAMRNRETYATSGPRMAVRFFGSWDYSDDLLQQPDWLDTAYASGVPMGSELPAANAAGAAPRFAIWAIRDPQSGNLDRIQVIKGWVDDNGVTHEKIFDAAWAGDRQPDSATGKLPPVGNTVDAANATYANTIGAPQLATIWRDPTFDPTVEAFYYFRVIEIPTPRWSTFDAKLLGIAPPEPTSLQERAVTSAIWYTPGQ